MKKILVLFVFCILCAGCDKEPDDDNSILFDTSSLILRETSGPARFSFTADAPWTASTDQSWCHISPVSGNAGKKSILISVDTNDTGCDREVVITLHTNTGQHNFPIAQVAWVELQVSKFEFELPSKGGAIEFTAKSNVRLSCTPSLKSSEWIKVIDEVIPSYFCGLTTQTFHLEIAPNESDNDRSSSFVISGGSKKEAIAVTVYGENSNNNYASTDFSADGKVTQIQKATEGNGVDIILMGDAFSDRQIADGTYVQIMRDATEAFFSVEPYTTYRDLFNVYAVSVVSLNQGYFDASESTLKTYFGKGTLVGGDNNLCSQYAMKVPGMTDDKLDNTLIVVMMNEKSYAGTCYMSYPGGRNDYGCGRAIAYFPLGRDEKMFAQLLHHEGGGHGFAKLADEYSNTGAGQIPQSEIDNRHKQEGYGWLKNIDFTEDLGAVKWSRFITDSRYKYDKLGAFEGACTYEYGVYRPTSSNIMTDNRGVFNAPSRLAIYYRIHRLAYGVSWTYDYETFVRYDATNRATEPSAGIQDTAHDQFEPLHPPVIF